MLNNVMKHKSPVALTQLLRTMAMDKKYRVNINYIRMRRAVGYFKLAARKKNMKIKDKFSTLVAVASLLKLN